MVMQLFSSSPPLFPNPNPNPNAKLPISISFHLRRATSLLAHRAAFSTAVGEASEGGIPMVRRPDKEVAAVDPDEEEVGGAFDRSITEIAKKVPLFEPERRSQASAATERLLPINLELWLHRAKVHTRKIEFAEAEKILSKV